jgi:peptidoglycan/LPS O-acetylase OafA/YrhL
MWLAWILNPLLMSTWIFGPMHYWNAVSWSISCQAGFYFLFPFIAR